MVPSNRLLFWTAVLFVPLASLAPTVPPARWVLAGLGAAFFVLVAGDALGGRRRMAGIQVSLPELVRLQMKRTGVLPVGLRHSAGAQTVRLGLPLPAVFGNEEPVQAVRLSGATGASQFPWPLRSAERGRFVLDRIYLEVASPLGFWAARSRQAARCEVRVYPNLFDERRQVAALFLRRAMAGAHLQRSAGQGREFEKLRGYLAGDPLSDIHWKASAKRGALVSRVHQVERSHEVYVAIDASRLSGRLFQDASGAPASALERYVSAALLLALAAEQQGDQFGLITFSDQVHACVRARSGVAHFNTCRDALYTLRPRKVSPDFDELFTFLRLRLRKRALLIVLTALEDPVVAEGFARASQLVARQHLLFVNVLRAPEVSPLFEPDSFIEQGDELYGRLAGHLRWRQLRELQRTLQRRGVRLSLLDPAKITQQLVAQHAEVRARQLV